MLVVIAPQSKNSWQVCSNKLMSSFCLEIFTSIGILFYFEPSRRNRRKQGLLVNLSTMVEARSLKYSINFNFNAHRPKMADPGWLLGMAWLEPVWSASKPWSLGHSAPGEWAKERAHLLCEQLEVDGRGPGHRPNEDGNDLQKLAFSLLNLVKPSRSMWLSYFWTQTIFLLVLSVSPLYTNDIPMKHPRVHWLIFRSDCSPTRSAGLVPLGASAAWGSDPTAIWSQILSPAVERSWEENMGATYPLVN
jgi:hypothetical protein